MADRYLAPWLEKLTAKKFLLISGPRQSGKTTLAKQWLARNTGVYLNWDIGEDRDAILEKPQLHTLSHRLKSHPFLVLDELHKYSRWKNWLKGLYDRDHPFLRAIVTGSATLDVFRKGSDSMLGRYESLRLHPFSIGELTHGAFVKPPSSSEDWLVLGEASAQFETWEKLSRSSGFPEPYLADDPLQYRRWSIQRRELILRQDLREITAVKSIALVEQLVKLMPGRVGSPLSINALRGDLEVAFDTVSTWLEILERLYFSYRITPYHRNLKRALKKERKLYLYDAAAIMDSGGRFENEVANHLLKSIHLWNDLGYGEFELQYLRDREKREVDFCISESGKPRVMIECKLNDRSLSPHLDYFRYLLGEEIPAIQLVRDPNVEWRKGLSRVCSAHRYLAALN